jgi:hypothetical protein
MEARDKVKKMRYCISMIKAIVQNSMRPALTPIM